MIKVLIVEDELLAAKRLKKMLLDLDHDITIVEHCDSIEHSIAFLNTGPDLDLMFMDIKLGDGLSLEILEKVEVRTPIIFTTAYDEYSLKAFKLNSIDYLLKPIDAEELAYAVEKYKSLYIDREVSPDMGSLLSKIMKTQAYKERFLIKHGNQLVIVPNSEVAYFYTEEGYTHLVTNDQKKYILDDTLDTIQKEVNPAQFFRINRAAIVKIESILKIEQYFNSRYSLQLLPPFNNEVIVSRERVREFKEWIGG